MSDLYVELEGKIFLVERDEKDEVISKSELDGQLCLNVLRKIIEENIEDIVKELKEEKSPTTKGV